MKALKIPFYLIVLMLLSSCVQKSHPKDITVKVNMTGIDSVQQVGLRGEFPLSWDETTYLEDTDGDGIYEGQFQIYTASNSIEFKFVNLDNQFELKDQANRQLNFEYQPETLIYEAQFDSTKDIKITRK